MAKWTARSVPDQSGKLAIVTGATGGLGLQTALELAALGAEVILAGRNGVKGAAAELLIRERSPGAKVLFEAVNLASLASVTGFAERMLTANRAIDILVNNAGVMAPRHREVTVDGFEMQFGTNYLSHFALTAKLLPLLKAGNARVVQLSSVAHRSGRIRLDDLNYQRGYKAFHAYRQSKLAMLMFAIELDRRSTARGWGLTSVAAHPGLARTELFANSTAIGARGLLATGINLTLSILGHSAAAGAQPTLMAATSPNASGGQYFGPKGWLEMKGRAGLAKIEPKASNQAISASLWDASEQMTGLAFR